MMRAEWAALTHCWGCLGLCPGVGGGEGERVPSPPLRGSSALCSSQGNSWTLGMDTQGWESLGKECKSGEMGTDTDRRQSRCPILLLHNLTQIKQLKIILPGAAGRIFSTSCGAGNPRTSQQGYEVCKLLATLLLFIAAFSEAVGVTGGQHSSPEAQGNVLLFLPQLQPWQASNLPLCQEMQEPDLLCRFCSARGPAVGRCTLQLKAVFQLQCTAGWGGL